jgi:hypothetical protein
MQAFKCDKCKEFVDGKSAGTVHVYFTEEPQAPKVSKTDFCSGCLKDVVEFLCKTPPRFEEPRHASK